MDPLPQLPFPIGARPYTNRSTAHDRPPFLPRLPRPPTEPMTPSMANGLGHVLGGAVLSPVDRVGLHQPIYLSRRRRRLEERQGEGDA